MRVITWVGSALLSLMLTAAPAAAAWLQATSRHFVIYADEKPETLRQRAEHLELVDQALRLLHRVDDDGQATDPNKLTIYVTRDLAELRKVYGAGGGGVAGFYLPLSEGAVAFTPAEADSGGRTALSPRIVLFHEYAHHFLLGNTSAAYPAWFSEGYAEFISTMRIERDQLVVGTAAAHRGNSLYYGDVLPLEAVFDPPAKMTGDQVESIYSRGWLMTHYLLLDPERAKQLDRYLRAFNEGTPSLVAARAAFGDLRAFESAMTRYVVQHKLPARGAPRAGLPVPQIAVRPLSEGEAAMIGARMLSARGVTKDSAATTFAAGSRIAARYPDDPAVQGWLAEMAYDAAADDAAEVAADRALARDPTQIQALLYKAKVRMRRAEASKTAADWRTARSYIIRANQAAPDNAAALSLFYSSFLAEGQRPTRNAVDALVRAQELVPQARDLRFMLVRQYLSDGKRDQARRALLPLAYDPHARGETRARRLLAALDAKADDAALRTLLADDAKPEDEAGTGTGTEPGAGPKPGGKAKPAKAN